MLHLNFPAASLVDFWKEPEAEESAEEQRLTQEVPWVESTTWMMVGIAEHLLGTWKHIYCKWNTCSKRISSMTQRTCHNFIRFYIRKHVHFIQNDSKTILPRIPRFDGSINASPGSGYSTASGTIRGATMKRWLVQSYTMMPILDLWSCFRH